jgi:DNA-binding NarL/FixJ family response regulator
MTIRVVLADDHTMVRDALAGLLDAEPDIEVVGVASDGHAAVELVRSQRPDVTLLDISMPGLNGIETAAVIQKWVPECRIVALSALGDRCFVEQMVAAGAVGYVLKSSSVKELAEAVRAVNGGLTYLPEDLGEASLVNRAKLSRREREVLNRLATGRRGSQVAEDMGVAVKTVDTYRRRIMHKLGLRNQSELIRYALALGGSGPSRE